MTNIASRLRHAGARNFPLQYDTDMQVSFLVVADIAARYSIPLRMRKIGMEVKVLNENKVYELNAYARGTNEGDDLQYWTERSFGDYILQTEKGVAGGVPPLDSDGYIPTQYLKNIYLTNVFVVETQSQRVALPTNAGDTVIQTVDNTVWIKLNSDNPAGLDDFVEITSQAAAVVSVNGQVGAVEIDFNELLNYEESLTQFNTAVFNSTAFLNLQASIAQLQEDLQFFDTYTRDEIDAFLDLKADKTNVLPLDGSQAFTPSSPYQPATKEYVDQNAGTGGGGAGTIVIGELYTVDNEAGSAQTVGTNFIKITQFNKKGIEAGASADLTDQDIEISVSGYYEINAALSLAQLAAGGVTHTFTIFVNGSETDLEATFKTTTDTSEDLSITGILYLSLGSIIDIRVKTSAVSTSVLLTKGLLGTKAITTGQAATQVKHNFSAVVPPTVTNDSTEGYSAGSRWVDIAGKIHYVLVDATQDNAEWKITAEGTYTHTQMATSALWTVNHNLNRFPSVTVVNNDKNEIIGDIHYTDSNTLTISFAGAYTGKAYLN